MLHWWLNRKPYFVSLEKKFIDRPFDLVIIYIPPLVLVDSLLSHNLQVEAWVMVRGVHANPDSREFLSPLLALIDLKASP